MATSGTSNTPLRVTILSDSVMQRASLKELLQQQGSEIVYENSIGAVDPTDLNSPADVLLVDLKNAGDASLDKLDDIIDSNNLPVLFNDGATIPMEDGPVRDDWANNLTIKLFSLANKQYLIRKPETTGKPKPGKTAIKGKRLKSISLKKSFPRVAVISRSNTRRTVLKHILRQQGLKYVQSLEFAMVNPDELEKSVHILLIDQHSMGKEEKKVLENIKRKNGLSYLLCNSSKIPLSNEERQVLGNKLLRKLTSKATRHSLNRKNADAVALYESKHYITSKAIPTSSADNSETRALDNPVENRPSLFEQDPAHWADKLSDELAGVRKNIRNINLQRNKPEQAATQSDSTGSAADESDTAGKSKTKTVLPNVVKLPVSNKNRDKITDTTSNAVVVPATESSDTSQTANANPVETNPGNKKQAQFAGILDIFSDMIKAVREVPEEKKTTFETATSSNTTDEPVDDQANEQAYKDSAVMAANDAVATDDVNLPIDFNMDEDFSFDMGDNEETELAFELELRSLKEELEIFEYDKHSLELFEQNPVANKKKSILGINWSNPFK